MTHHQCIADKSLDACDTSSMIAVVPLVYADTSSLSDDIIEGSLPDAMNAMATFNAVFTNSSLTFMI